MNLETVAGVYVNAKKVIGILGAHRNVTQLSERLRSLGTSTSSSTIAEIFELGRALDALDSHIRLLGLEEVSTLK